MFACMSPWVKNNARTLKMKALRFIKLPDKIGCFDFRSVRINPDRLTKDENNTIRKGVDVQPKFCPNEGTHRSKLKKISINTAPETSKFCSGFLTDSWFLEAKTHAVRIPAQMATHTHSIVRQP